MYNYNPYSSSNRSLKRYNKMFYFEDTLKIESYFIGHKSEGEAILFVIRCDGKICYSGLVDCYETSEVGKVTELLRNNDISKLNFICWTHPDLDHSKGLKNIIDNFTSEDTHIWIPENIEINEIECSQEVRDLFAYLKECVIDKTLMKKVYTASDMKNLLFYDSICFENIKRSYPLEITSFTPNSAIIRKQSYLDKFIKNDRSIFFSLAIGDVRILLTGDVEDETINRIPKEYFGDHVHILKIPHHGSASSKKILELGWDGCDIACSTVYRRGRSNLPVADVMESYKSRSNFLFCTGSINKEVEENEFGILKIVTDVLENSYETKTEGNAKAWGT